MRHRDFIPFLWSPVSFFLFSVLISLCGTKALVGVCDWDPLAIPNKAPFCHQKGWRFRPILDLSFCVSSPLQNLERFTGKYSLFSLLSSSVPVVLFFLDGIVSRFLTFPFGFSSVFSILQADMVCFETFSRRGCWDLVILGDIPYTVICVIWCVVLLGASYCCCGVGSSLFLAGLCLCWP